MALAVATPEPIRSPRSIASAAHVAFIPVGMATVLLGPMLPTLSQRWSLSYTQAGYLFSAQFLGATIGVTASGTIIRRWGYRNAMMLGLGTLAIGLASLPLLSFAGGLLSIVGYGMAIGLMGPTCNLVVADSNPGDCSAALSVLNFWWSVGAVSCPLLVFIAARAQHTLLLLYSIAGIAFVLTLTIGLVTPSLRRTRQSTLNLKDGRRVGFWSQPGFVVLCGLFFLYVGTENSVGGWLGSYAVHNSSGGGNLPVATSSFFYLALLFGRMLAPWLLRHIGELTLARVGLGVSIAGILSLVSFHRLEAIMLSSSIAGLGLAAVFPIAIAMLSRRYGSESPRAGSALFNMANIGGATLPLLVGYTSDHFGSLSSGLIVALVATAMMLVLFYMPFRMDRPPAAT